MGFAIWLKDVYNWHVTTGIQENARTTMILFFCLSTGYQHTEAVGSLQDWDLPLHPDCQHKIQYHCFISSHFNVYATEAKTLWCILIKISFGW